MGSDLRQKFEYLLYIAVKFSDEDIRHHNNAILQHSTCVLLNKPCSHAFCKINFLQGDRQTDRHRERDRERERVTERVTERERESYRESNGERERTERERENSGRRRETERNRERNRERERERERERNRKHSKYFITVSSDIFASFIFAKFLENKVLAKWRNQFCRLLIYMYYLRILSVANMSFNAYRENKILSEISEFTVHSPPSFQTKHRDSP